MTSRDLQSSRSWS